MAASEPPRPDDGAPRRWTLADIAADAGVSPSTVSRVMRGSPLVNEQMRARVLETAARVGFAPDAAARSMATGLSPFVGMVVPNVGQIFYAQVFRGAREVLGRHGLQVLLVESEHDPERETAALRTLQSHRVSGVLMATLGGYEPMGAPVVFFDHVHADAGVGEVTLGDREGAELIVEHLLQHGHRRIAHIGEPRGMSPHGHSPAEERRDGIKAALARHWLAVPDDYIREVALLTSEPAAAAVTAELLAYDPPPTAIVTGTNRLAMGVLRGLRALGKRVPEDVALVSFGDSDSGDLMDPALTVVSHRPHELGRRAATILLQQLEQPGERIAERLSVELTVRRSCGCAWGDAPALPPLS